MIDFGLPTRDRRGQYTFLLYGLCLQELLLYILVPEGWALTGLESGWLTWKLLWLLRHTRVS
jgi:hypothetical protein